VAVEEPGVWRWALKVAASVGITGMLCCVAPTVLFMFGLMGGVYAISFANLFYQEDGSAGLGAWLLRGAALLIGIGGFVLFQRKQNRCSVDPARKRKNLVLVALLILVVGVGLFLTLEKVTGWYFDEYVVPAQQRELEEQSGAGS